MFIVYNDADQVIGQFEHEAEAWEFANSYTAEHYAEDGCAYVERQAH